jgi:hypothetical protein
MHASQTLKQAQVEAQKQKDETTAKMLAANKARAREILLATFAQLESAKPTAEIKGNREWI